jgi:uncharacterized protein (TIRG00374 family)
VTAVPPPQDLRPVPDSPAEPRRLSRATWVMGVLLLIALVFVVAHLGEEQRFAALLRDARPRWLLAAVLLQLGTYVCAAAVWSRAIAIHGRHRSVGSLIPLGLARLFIDQAMPSAGVSGTLIVIRGIARRGVRHEVAVAAFLVGLVSFYLAYGVALAMSLTVLWLLGHLSRVFLWLTSGFLAVALLVPLSVLWLRSHGARRLPGWLLRSPPVAALLRVLGGTSVSGLRRPGLLLETTGLQLCIFALDAATLGVALLAVGATAPAGALFASFVMASLVATLTVVPGGIGTFDTTCVAMLRVTGVPIEAALAATLLFRGFSLFLPLLPGLWLARREMA